MQWSDGRLASLPLGCRSPERSRGGSRRVQIRGGRAGTPGAPPAR